MNGGAPRIAIVTPVWNGLPFLTECIESVTSQGVSDWEWIISDDGSTDGSREVLEKLKDPRIRVTMQPKNLGIFGNLNFLFTRVTAPITYILCQDDYFYSDALATVLRHWDKAQTDLSYIAFNRTLGKERVLKELPEFIQPHDSDFFYYLCGNLPGNLSNVSVRTSVPEMCGWFDQSFPYVGDYEFWSRAGRRFPFKLTTDKTTYVRRHENVASVHLNRKGEYVKQIVHVQNVLYDRLCSIYPPRSLRLHGAIMDAQQRHAALMALLRTGDATYWRTYCRDSQSARFRPNQFLSWVIYMLSGGAHFLREIGSRPLLRERHKKNAKVKS